MSLPRSLAECIEAWIDDGKSLAGGHATAAIVLAHAAGEIGFDCALENTVRWMVCGLGNCVLGGVAGGWVWWKEYMSAVPMENLSVFGGTTILNLRRTGEMVASGRLTDDHCEPRSA